jgi:hypothetical protein
MSDSDKGTFERVGSGVGGLTGKAADTAVDLMGSMLGTVGRTVGGWWAQRSPDDAVNSFSEEQDRSCRQHFEQVHRSNSQHYDAVRPLYQFGHLAGSNPDYQGRSFEDVEVDLKNAWTGDASQKYGDWSTVRDYVGTGYRSGSGGRTS